MLFFGGDVRHTAKGVVEDGRHKGESVSNALYRTRRKSLEQFKLIEIPGKRPPAEYWGHSLVPYARARPKYLGRYDDGLHTLAPR